MIGSAAGVGIGRSSFIPKEKNIQTLFLLLSGLLLIDIIFIRAIRKIFSGIEGEYLPFTTQIIGLVIALIPVSATAGLMFQWTAKRYINENETLAKAYSIESAGGILGGLCSTLFLNFEISNLTTGLICSTGCVIVAIYYSWQAWSRFQKYFSSTIILVIFFLFVLSYKIDVLMTSWNHPFVVESIDTPYNRVTITSPEKQVCVFTDDALSYETESVSAEEFVHLSTLQSDTYNNILILGGGFEGVIAEILKLPVNKIDYVEINKSIIEALQKHLPKTLINSLRDKKVNFIFKDPRQFLQSQHLYDVILVGMPEPMSAQSNRFYTKEFFAQCSKALKQRGVIAFKIRSSENLWTKLLTERNKGIYYALKSAFENTIVLPGAFNIFIASKSKLTTDTKFLINRFLERELETKLVSPQYINYIFTNTRFAEIQRILLEGTQNVNSDLQPVCYGYTISIWLSKFFPELANYNKPLYKILDFNKLLIIAAIIIVGLTIAGRKSFQAGRLVLVFGTAFIGMIAETLLIILYQTKNGVLYRDIGILLMMFMLGLTLGAVIIHRLFILQKLKRFKLAGIILILLFTFMNLVIYFVTKTDMLGGLLSISALLMLNGIIVSGIFAYTSFNKVINQLEIVKPLYSADLIGGSLGSIIASLIFIPVLGLLSTSLFLIAMTFSLIFLII